MVAPAPSTLKIDACTREPVCFGSFEYVSHPPTHRSAYAELREDSSSTLAAARFVRKDANTIINQIASRDSTSAATAACGSSTRALEDRHQPRPRTTTDEIYSFWLELQSLRARFSVIQIATNRPAQFTMAIGNAVTGLHGGSNLVRSVASALAHAGLSRIKMRSNSIPW